MNTTRTHSSERPSERHRARATAALLAFTITSGLAIPSANADDKAACAEAYQKGQDLRNKGEFTSAREQLVLCAKPTCKDWMVAECTRWLDEVERRQPTVVLTAEDGRGELVDLVKVTDESGRAIAEGVTGRAIAVDPGPHELTFIARDGSRVKVLKMIQEGQQVVSVKAVFNSAEAKAGSTSIAAEATRSPASPWRTVGLLVGGAGIVGLGVGTVFGLVALNEKNEANCDSSDVCDRGTTRSVESAALVSTLGFFAGAALLVGGAAMVLFGPSGRRPTAARTGLRSLRATPVTTPTHAAVVMGASF